MSKRDLFDRCMWLTVGTAMWTVTLSGRETLDSCPEVAHLSFLAGSLPLFLLGIFLTILAGYLLDEKWPARAFCVFVGSLPLTWLMTWDKDGARSSISILGFIAVYWCASIPASLGEVGRIIVRKLRDYLASRATS
jgi:hypothetical protein